MKCSNHKAREASASCTRCGKALCDECRVDLGDQSWCRECLGLAVERAFVRGRGWRTSRWAAALLSIIPGAGHMYLGLIGKGFALMAFLFAAVFLIILYSASTGMYWMSAYLIPTLTVLLFTYAIFDAIGAAEHLREEPGAERREDPIMERIWGTVFLNPKAAGYVLLAAGIIGLIDLIGRPLTKLIGASLAIGFPLTALIIPVALVVLGILLLRRGRRGV